MSSSFLLLLLVVLALTFTSEARPNKLKQILSPPVAVASPLATPTIAYLYGCYYSTRNQLQCPAGATIQLSVYGVSEAPTAITIGPSYTCGNIALNITGYPQVTCTLPTAIDYSDYGVLFNITITAEGQTSAPFQGVEFVRQPVLPVITSVLGCAGGEGTTASGCRTGQQLTITGTGFYGAPFTVTVGPYSLGCWNIAPILCNFPAFKEQDLGVVFPVTINLNGYTNTYTPGLSSYGTLSLDSITGCGVTTGSVAGCSEGDVVTLTGSGFNLGGPGDPNSLFLVVNAKSPPSFVVVSNTVIQVTLPSPPIGFSLSIIVAAGTGMLPVRTKTVSVAYTSVLTVASTYGTMPGCSQAWNAKYPTCDVGGILATWIQGGTPSDIQTVTIIGPSGRSYNCGSLYVNMTTLACTVPQVASMDLGQVLGITVATSTVTSPVYESGLLIPLANRRAAMVHEEETDDVNA